MTLLNVLNNYRAPANFYFEVNILDPTTGAAVNVAAANVLADYTNLKPGRRLFFPPLEK